MMRTFNTIKSFLKKIHKVHLCLMAMVGHDCREKFSADEQLFTITTSKHYWALVCLSDHPFPSNISARHERTIQFNSIQMFRLKRAFNTNFTEYVPPWIWDFTVLGLNKIPEVPISLFIVVFQYTFSTHWAQDINIEIWRSAGRVCLCRCGETFWSLHCRDPGSSARPRSCVA